jgi:hypothetical protein
MDIFWVKLIKIAIIAGVLLAPFVFWLFIYGLLRFSSVDPQRVKSWLRTLRWVTWIPAAALMLVAIVNHKFHYLFFYGSGLFSFSAGLSFPESWLKKRLGLEKIDEGWGLDRD